MSLYLDYQAYNCLIHFYIRDCYDNMIYDVMTYHVMRYDEDLKKEDDLKNEDIFKNKVDQKN